MNGCPIPRRRPCLRMLRITVRNESGKRLRLEPLRSVLRALAGIHSVPSSRIDVLVTTDERMKELNLAHRGLCEATDVLSFPGPDWADAVFGDIAVSAGFAEKGAESRGVP